MSSIEIRQSVTIIQRAGSDLACRCDGGGSGFALEVFQALPHAAVLIVEVAGRVALGAIGGALRAGEVAGLLVGNALLMLAPTLGSLGRGAIRLALTKGGE
jgi:hypothetical protein